MTITVTGFRGDDQYLVDYDDGTASIYDADEDWLYEPKNAGTLANLGYWNDPPADLPAALVQLLKDLNTARAVLSGGTISP
jgi:hypothetical protein